MAQRSFIALRFLVVIAGLVAAPLPAQAAGTVPQLEWLCLQGGDEAYTVVCLPVAGQSVATEQEGPSERSPADGALRRDLRPVAMRGDAEIFGVDAWHVPLYGPPTDPEGVRELLRAVLCGRQAGCTVRYQDGEPAMGLQARLR